MIQKTFGLSHREVMWEESWINVTMKMKDMPYYSHESAEEGKEGTLDDLQNHFGKYIEK